MIKKFIIWIPFCITVPCIAATPQIASKNYVDANKADWAETDATKPTFIENKPNIATEISDTTAANALPTVGATKTAIDKKADSTDLRFDTIPISQPEITPPSGRAIIWIE